MKKFSPLIAAVTGAAILTLVGYVQAFSGHGGHHHHHGSPALAACLAATPESAKTSFRATFKGSSLHSDRKAAWMAKQNLEQAILANPKSTSLGGLESALSSAQLKVIQDEDGIAESVCGALTGSQLTAASTLYTNLQNNRQTVRGYFEAAHAASE